MADIWTGNPLHDAWYLVKRALAQKTNPADPRYTMLASIFEPLEPSVGLEDKNTIRRILFEYRRETSDTTPQSDPSTSSPGEAAAYTTEDWWLEKLQALYKTFQADPVGGSEEWFTTFADALLAWRLDVCKQLVSEPSLSLLEARDLWAHYQQGIQGILDEDYPRALTTLEDLTTATSSRESKPLLKASSRAALLIFMGRIYLYQPPEGESVGKQLEQARQFFEQARQLTPDDGRPSAALGECYRLQGNRSEARRACRRAIDQAPDQPDGYLVQGLLLEDDAWWDAADEQYAKAIDTVGSRDVETVNRALDRLLAPVSGNVYLRLARMLKDDDPEQARDAAVGATRIGMQRVARLQIKHGEDYVESVGFRLLGEVFDVLEEPTNAALAYYESARRFIPQNEYEVARELLKHASERYPNYAPIYWYWAHTLHVLAAVYQNADPSEQVKRAQEALDVWDKGYGFGPPSPDFAWAYLTRALIVEALAGLQPEQAKRRWWEEVVNLEQGLLLEHSNASMWAALGRSHRSLSNYAVALQAVERSLSLNGDALDVLGERALILATLGQSSGREAIDHLREKFSDTPAATEYVMFADLLEAHLLFQEQEYAQTVPLLNAVVDREPTNVSVRTTRGQARRRVGDHQGALEDFRWIWENTSPTMELANPDSLNRGWAAYELGYYAEAIEIFQRLLGGISLAPFDCRINLALCYLALGQLQEAETWFDDALAHLRYRVSMQAALQDLAELEQRLAEQPERTATREAIVRYRQILSARKEEPPQIEDPKAAELELRQVLEIDQPKTDSFLWLAATAGLARMDIEAERWEEAGARYHSILETDAARTPSWFPQARGGLLVVAKVYAHLGFEAAARGDLPSTQDHFRRSFELCEAAEVPNAVSHVLKEIPGLITSTKHAETLNAALGTLTDAPPSLGEGGQQRLKPALTAALPEGWFVKESITLLDPDGQANVIASTEPLDPNIDAQWYAEVQGDLLRREFREYREFHFGPTRVFGGRQGYMRRFEWTPPEADAVPVTQLQLYYAENGRGYTATATTPTSQIQRFELLLRQILGGLRIEP